MILQLILTLVNLVCVVINYKNGSYGIAIFCAFAAGFCFAAFLSEAIT